jgi:hypothetical protein
MEIDEMNAVIAGEILFNAFFCSVVGVLLIKAYSRFSETVLHEFRFKFFSIRDDLQLMAVRGQISEDAEEYVLLRRTLSRFIKSASSMGFIPLSQAIIQTARETEREDLIRRILENADLARLYEDTFSLMLSAFFHNSWILRTLYRMNSSYRLAQKLLQLSRSDALASQLRRLWESVSSIEARQREFYNSPMRPA